MRIYITLCAVILFSLGQAQELVGDSLMAVGRYDRALMAYKNTPETAQREFKMARAATSMGNLNDAAAYYRSGFEKDSLTIRPIWEYGKLVLGNNDYVSALQIFKKLTDLEPDNPAFHFYLGKTFSSIEMDKEAITSFEQALQLNEEYRSARIELVKSYIAKKENLKASILCDLHLRKQPDDIKVNSLLAQSLMNSNYYSKAIPVLEHLFELGLDTEYNRKSLAFALYNLSEYQKSLEQYEIFQSDYDEKDPIINFMMSKCYMKLNQLDKAQDFIERAIVFKTPILDQEYLQLASIYALKKDYKNTLGALKKASKENPNSDDIAYQVAIGADRYYKSKKEKLKYYEQFIENYPNSDYVEIASARVSDLKKELFMAGEE
jgi:tetratricopeptide (TPR) repeat protein